MGWPIGLPKFLGLSWANLDWVKRVIKGEVILGLELGPKRGRKRVPKGKLGFKGGLWWPFLWVQFGTLWIWGTHGDIGEGKLGFQNSFKGGFDENFLG